MENDAKPRVSTGLAIIFAIASGLAVGNLYWAQPLLAQISAGFGVPTAQGGLLVTATQIGYAAGILLIVPLGDIVHRRRLIGTVMALSVAALIACAAAPSFAFLGFALAALGLTTLSGQIILPLAGDLASPAERGKTVGIVSSGITTGILVSRFVSGVVANSFDWRVIYVVAAVLNLAMMFVIVRSVPDAPKKQKVSYPKLIGGVFTSIVRYKSLRYVLVINGMVFGIAFNLFWNALTFLLSGPGFGFNPLQIGLVSLAGLFGALSASAVGSLQDRGLAVPALGVSIVLSALCMLAAAFAGASIVAIVAIAAVQSLAMQGVGVLNQTRIFGLSDTERSRLNTAFVVNNFIFAAIGSALATAFWNIGGWPATGFGGTVACLVALVAWIAARKAFAEDEERRVAETEASDGQMHGKAVLAES